MAPRTMLLVVAVATLLPGCRTGTEPPAPGPAPEPAPSATTASANLHVSLERPRYLVLRRMLEFILRNDGDVPVTVDTLQLDSPFFTTVEAAVDRVVVPPHDRVDVAVDYGEAVCPAPSDAHGARLGINGAPPRRLTLEDADAAIGLVHDEECNRMAVAAAADIEFGTDWEEVSDRVVRTSLVMRRRDSSERIVLEELHGGVIWAMAPTGPAKEGVITLLPGEDEGSAGIEFKILRCDPHGMAESKKTYRYPIWVAVGDIPGVYVEIEPTGDGRALMERMLSECANGPMGTGQG